MSRKAKLLSDHQGWLTFNVLQHSDASARVAPSRSAQRRWVELLGTVLTIRKEQSGAVQGFICIRGGIGVLRTNGESYGVEVILPSKSAALEVDSLPDAKVWLQAIRRAVGLDNDSPASVALLDGARQLLRDELETPHVVVPLAVAGGKECEGNEKPRTFLAVVHSAEPSTPEFAVFVLSSRGGQWSVERTFAISTDFEYEKDDAEIETGLKFSFSEDSEDKQSVVTLALSYSCRDEAVRDLFLRELNYASRISAGIASGSGSGSPPSSPRSHAASHPTFSWLDYYDNTPDTLARVERPFVSIVQCVPASPRGSPDSSPSASEPDLASPCSAGLGLASVSALQNPEFVLSVSEQACEGLTKPTFAGELLVPISINQRLPFPKSLRVSMYTHLCDSQREDGDSSSSEDELEEQKQTRWCVCGNNSYTSRRSEVYFARALSCMANCCHAGRSPKWWRLQLRR